MNDNKIMVDFFHNNNETSADELRGNLYEHEQTKEINKMKTKEPENKRMFIAKYLGATNTKGTKFKIIDTRNRGKSFIYSWDYEKNGLTDQALEVFKQCNIKIEGYSEPWNWDDSNYFFTSDFKTMLTKKGGK